MNPYTGSITDLPELGSAVGGGSMWPPIGEQITPSGLPTDSDAVARGLDDAQRRDLEAIRKRVYDGEPIVVVSAAVAHQQRVGSRELGRRAQRRKARRSGRGQ